MQVEAVRTLRAYKAVETLNPSRNSIMPQKHGSARNIVLAEYDTVTYVNANLTDTIKLFEQNGVRFLAADEIRTAMPEYPL